jgi:signal transduction histidine kinase
VEAVTNLVRHADATTAAVRLMIDGDMIRIEVVDDGVGLAGPAIGVGSRATFEARGGGGRRADDRGRPNGGTRRVALLPVPEPARGR